MANDYTLKDYYASAGTIRFDDAGEIIDDEDAQPVRSASPEQPLAAPSSPPIPPRPDPKTYHLGRQTPQPRRPDQTIFEGYYQVPAIGIVFLAVLAISTAASMLIAMLTPWCHLR